MTDKVKMNYGFMRELTKAFQNAAKQLEDTLSAVQKQGKSMQAGGLQGKGGETFANAINGPTTKAIKKLIAKMNELAKDVDNARARLEEGVKTAQSRFQ